MHCHFLLQIVRANCSILPDGLCTHSHILTLHTVYSHGHPELPKRVSAQMVSLWKVPGRKSEAESLDFPTPHSPAQLRSPSRFHQHHSRIPVPCLAPHQVPGTQVRYGSQETRENTPAFSILFGTQVLSPSMERYHSARGAASCQRPTRADFWTLSLHHPSYVALGKSYPPGSFQHQWNRNSNPILTAPHIGGTTHTRMGLLSLHSAISLIKTLTTLDVLWQPDLTT